MTGILNEEQWPVSGWSITGSLEPISTTGYSIPTDTAPFFLNMFGHIAYMVDDNVIMEVGKNDDPRETYEVICALNTAYQLGKQ